jgi:conjugal transfer pilus assembly protein TraF
MSVIRNMTKTYATLLVSLFCLACMSIEASADSFSFLDDKARGWHWYEMNEEIEEKRNPEPKQVKIKGSTPTERIENLREQVQERLNAAIDEPTEENIKNYLVVQNLLMAKSEKFSSQWQRVIYSPLFWLKPPAFSRERL